MITHKTTGTFTLALIILSCASCALTSTTSRSPDYPIVPLFLKRQSKYALQRKSTNDQLHVKLKSLFEAARWAPSSFNDQPWRFIYGLHGTHPWDKLFAALMPFNKEWVSQAGALILVLSRTTFEKTNKPSKTHSFDAGLATMQLLLQATQFRLVAHPMSGFDQEAARKAFEIPQEYSLEAMIAVGDPAPAGTGKEIFIERDKKPATRKKIEEIAKEGMLPH